MSSLAEHAFEALWRTIRSTNCSEFIVAFSGGRDSSALLHIAADFAREAGTGLLALHVDHGLHDDSGAWAEHCQLFASALGVAFKVARIGARPPPGASVEAWARQHRYARLADEMAPTGCVLTAHHADDQAETVLQRVLSGAGPHGLAAMRELRTLRDGHLARPLLHCSASMVDQYARQHDLNWVDDPSNRDPRYLRNRLRGKLLPLLETTYPGTSLGLQRLATIQASVADALDLQCDEVLGLGDAPRHQLSLASIRACAPGLRAFLIRRAILRAGLNLAGERHLHEITRRLCPARIDASPIVSWAGNEVRRYRDVLYFMRRHEFEAPSEPLPWLPNSELRLPWGVLRATPGFGQALDTKRMVGRKIEVVFRRGGERCRPLGRGHEHRLKKLFQEYAIPPWERALHPLIYVDGQLAAVASLFVCEDFAADEGDKGLVLEWHPAFYVGDTALT